MCKPRDGVIVLYLVSVSWAILWSLTYRLPLARNVRYRHRCVLADIYDDVFWAEPVLGVNRVRVNVCAAHLECALSRVFSSTSEQAGRLCSEVSSFLSSPVDDCMEVRLLQLILRILDPGRQLLAERHALAVSRFLLLLSHRFLLLPLPLKVLVHRLEIALLQ